MTIYINSLLNNNGKHSLLYPKYYNVIAIPVQIITFRYVFLASGGRIDQIYTLQQKYLTCRWRHEECQWKHASIYWRFSCFWLNWKNGILRGLRNLYHIVFYEILWNPTGYTFFFKACKSCLNKTCFLYSLNSGDLCFPKLFEIRCRAYP